MNALVGPALLPLIQIPLRRFQTFEMLPLQRGFLRVAHARFHFAFAIRILNADGIATAP